MNENQKIRKKFRFAIDRGGTFTDVIAFCPNDKIVTLKLLSENPSAYSDAPTEAIRRIIEKEIGIERLANPIDSEYIEWIRMGTTVATNALLEKKGEKFCLLVTKGFKDLLFIGNQSRPNLFDLTVKMPNVLYDYVIEVEERIIPFRRENEYPMVENENGTKYEVFIELNKEKLREDLLKLLKDKGIKNIAVLLAHSYNYNKNELEVEQVARELGFVNISLSHKIMPMIRMVPRGLTSCIDAYLTPCIKKYISNFLSGFIADNLKVLFMQSDGGLASVNSFTGSRAIISGPAGGYVGHALTTYNSTKAVIGFDMGGTSTDVSRYDGTYEHIFESIVAGYQIQAPQLDINTVAAGGGSRLFYQSGLFVVGPESASSNPGPTCYKKGGPLTITDANLILGRLLPEYFPKIFGPRENEPLDIEATRINFEKLATEIKGLSIEEIALGFINVANETMCRPIRNLTESKGYDTSKHILACFGGAGGQHACAIAKSLGIKQVYINKYAGILSAYGMALADITYEKQEPCGRELNKETMSSYIMDRINYLKSICIDYLAKNEGLNIENIKIEVYLNIRYQGTDTGIMCTPHEIDVLTVESFETAFLNRYRREYGFIMQNRCLLVDDIRIRAIGRSGIEAKSKDIRKRSTPLKPTTFKSVYFTNGYRETPIYLIDTLATGDKIDGPSIIIDKNCTILVEPGCRVCLNEYGDLEIEVLSFDTENESLSTLKLDRIQLSIFSQRFMSIAEQMGRILQRTSISTNIKERLDFSCAMFDQDGGLVANAPHIPVHLGAMQEAVKYQIEYFNSTENESLKEGDVILSNHPLCGGSHLPDLTIITPVFNDNNKPIFYVANRGHHQDIGGLTPGSMPPTSKYLWEEGACFKSFKIVKNGNFQEKELIEKFNEPGLYPGCSGSRCLNDNISDLKAQIAANNKGIELIKALIKEYSLEIVQFYMKSIQKSAEEGVRNLFKQLALKKSEYSAREFMDDGSNIDLKATIDQKSGSTIFDFTGTSYQVFGNLNTPKAIVYSAIIYCLRSMLNYDIPLNQGCLNPLKIIIPKGSLIWPSEEAAVVGGNVLTSQRIVDLILKCFSVCAASQGCMNNITFGNNNYSYYETVGGGAGAGPHWNGRSGVHTHMTNTRITDPEVLETRYPVVLKSFELREDSGGKGLFKGGDGLRRQFFFRDEMKLCILSERRVFTPYGLNGGQDGKRGKNTLKTKDGRLINLGAKAIVDIFRGDEFVLETPGAGGYGLENSSIINESSSKAELPTKGSLYLFKSQQESV